MFESLKIVKMAHAMAEHAGARQGLVAQNIANADTPGYKARDLADFGQSYAETGGLRATRPGHVGGGASTTAQVVQSSLSEDPNGNTVSLDQEMVRAVEIRQEHDMALSIYRATSDILRASLGNKG
ncbi:FlgB family protein [Falsirhodobacter sp. 20TX0035]|uniref:FlgB family protein n=1 Tax=Falsirhodobacter sp. 20TX0035 TaxID=3022019 RepID=UPI00232ED76B|nr:FlgB family protein [Falsirhodobacter sp. 20TX0035]MDB6452490.1 FlgB family protein [Falsirhodobacter sp. 20TX0035]